jgi:hypothetical protein
MFKPTTHFDQVPLQEIIEVVKQELQKEAVLPKRSKSTKTPDAVPLKKSGAARDGEPQ